MKTNTNNTNSSSKNARRISFAVILAFLFCLSTAGAVVFAARWLDQTNKSNNKVKLDQPVIVSVTGAASEGIIMPGVLESKVTTKFDISITGADKLEYKLVIRDIKYAFDETILENLRDDGYFEDDGEFKALFGDEYITEGIKGTPDAAAFANFLKEFQVSFNNGTSVNLVEGMILNADAKTITDQTVAISALDELQLIARGGTLTFTLALEVVPNPEP